jgi:hypothetical protein
MDILLFIFVAVSTLNCVISFQLKGNFTACEPTDDYFEFECNDSNTNDDIEKLKCMNMRAMIDIMKKMNDEYHKLEISNDIHYIYT